LAKYGSSKYGTGLYGDSSDHPYAGIPGKVMWVVLVDWDNNGQFDNGSEPQTIRRMHITRGREGARLQSGHYAQPGNERFEIEMYDPSGRYDILNTSSPIFGFMGAPGLRLKVVMISTTTKESIPVFVGTLTNIEYNSSEKTGVLSGAGLSRYLEIGAAEKIHAPCQSYTYLAWDSCFVWDGSTPTPFNYWKGRSGGLPLRECAGIVLSRAGWSMGAYYGAMVLNNEQPNYFYLDESTAWAALVELAEGFAARLFFLRDGRLFVMDRLDRTGLAAALDAPARAQEAFGLKRYSPLESLRNHVEVKIRECHVFPFNTPIAKTSYIVAWKNDGPISVPPSSYKDLIIRYTDVGKNTSYQTARPKQGSYVRLNQWDGTGALGEPYPLIVNSRADKLGVDMADPAAGLAEWNLLFDTLGTGPYGDIYVQKGNNQCYCVVRFRNWSPTLTAYFFNMQAQVIGIIEGGESPSRVIEASSSIETNGERELVIDSRWIQDTTMADNIGQAYLDTLSSREMASAAELVYQWSGETLYQYLENYDLGAFINYGAQGGANSLANFGLYNRWLIVGQEIEWLSPDGQDAFVTLKLDKGLSPAVNVTAVSTVTGSNISTMTWEHTVPEGENRLLIVSMSMIARANSYLQTVTYGGQAMTLLGGVQQNLGEYPRVETYYLKNPPVGTANVVTTNRYSNLNYMEGGAVSFENVDQTTPLGTPVYDWGTVGPAQCNVPAVAGSMVFDTVCYASQAGDASQGSLQTKLWGLTSDGNWKGCSSVSPGNESGSVTMDWTIPTNGFAQLAVKINPSAT